MKHQIRFVQDYQQLVDGHAVNVDCYLEPTIFEDELQRIFYTTWVYIGHESEVPEPGDYKQTLVGRQSVLLIRGDDQRVRVLLNRCSHRGATLCQAEYGRARTLGCSYHGWQFACDGTLKGVPYDDAYGPSFDRAEFGLDSPPRVESYRGFVFASFAAEGIPLLDHLGAPARAQIDLFCDLSPTGELEVRAGTNKYGFDANWKLQMENSIDGYHPNFVHRSFFQVSESRISTPSKLFVGDSTGQTRDLGNGHSMLDSRAYLRAHPASAAKLESLAATPWGQTYLADMYARYGEETARDIIVCGGTHMHIFPNLVLLQNQIRTIRPITADRTEVFVQPVMLGGVPAELNLARLRAHESFYGPGGGGVPDDIEIFSRVRAGFESQVNRWVSFARGLHRETGDVDGTTVAHMTDELPQRAMWRRWQEMMTEEQVQ